MLLLCKFPTSGGEISGDQTFSNPLKWELPDSDLAVSMDQRLWLRMENPYTQYCSEGMLYATDNDGTDESSWYRFALDDEGQPGTFQNILYFSIPLGSELPIWVRLSVPERVEVEPKLDIRIAATYIRHEIE